jgi:beta-lactamase regulating signal transducer with metallopeptidase domain/type II secretory pathway component GspD/PulD (secretin)
VNLQWLASPEWANVVKALLHTLWQGAIIAVVLGFTLRRIENPISRYRSSLAALAGILLAGLVTWAWLNRPAPLTNFSEPAPVAQTEAAPALKKNDAPPIIVQAKPLAPKPVELGWTAWLALVWLAGTSVMIARAGFQVAGAERLRRSTQPLEDARIAELLENARKAVGLARTVRLAVTNKLTSPAVVGVLVPTLILPLSLTTTLTHEQIRFILLHELAHIRRGDYFANLFQLFAEALLFFNPAVWWISRQMRVEREACCDALAIELSGAPADYARTLVHVAENVLQAAPAAAPAFGDEREPSSLADRVQRLLVPGYRPRLRLTWRAMLASLCVGGALLVLSAIGTRVTVAAILSPQQRIERIEKRMTELGQKPEVEDNRDSDERVTVVAHVRTPDGSPLHKERSVTVHSKRRNWSGIYGGWLSKEGWSTNQVQAGEIWVEANAKGYATAIVGPLDGITTNLVDAGEIVLEKGFDVQIRTTDAKTGAAITNATLQTWLHHIPTGDSLQSQRNLKTDAEGKATLNHCIPQNLWVTVNAPGYEISQTTFEKLSAGQSLELKLHPGVVMTGTVTEKLSGKPIAGANLQIIYQEGSTGGHHEWGEKFFHLATTEADGRYVINQLAAGVKYVLGVSAAGHESILLKPFTALAPRELPVELGPELIVRGQVSGVITQLQVINKDYCLSRNFSEEFEHTSYGHQEWVPLSVTNGIGYFAFTNRVAGKVTLNGLGIREERVITAPVNDWNLVVPKWQEREPKKLAKREVVFRFKNSSGVSPRGTVRVRIPSDEDPQHSAVSKITAITNGEVRVKIPFGYSTDIEPERMVGYMFNRTGEWRSPSGERGDWMNIQVGSNAAPLVIEIPLLPAGAIYARAKNADGSAAGGLFFGVREVKKAPGRDQNGLNDGDSVSGTAPRQWVSGALPLGGTYQIHGWRGNSFCISKPVKLTEANPDAEVEMQFAPGKTFNGVVLGPDGQPLREVEMKTSFSLADNHGFGLKNVFADERGRFQLNDTTPDLGTYSVEFFAPGIQAETVKLDFNIQPQVIRLKRGRTLAGQMIDSVSGQPIPGMEVRAADYEKSNQPQQQTQTDDNGRFEFTTLGDGNYSLYPDGGQLVDLPRNGNLRFRADGNTNIVLRVKLYEWSKLKPKSPVAMTNASATPQFPTRVFKLDTNRLAANLPKRLVRTLAGDLRGMITNAGVNLDSPAGKAVYFNYTNATLLVRATEADLNVIEKLVQGLNHWPLQVHIKARFIEVKQDDKAFGIDWYLRQFDLKNLTNTSLHIPKALPLGDPEVMALNIKGVRNAHPTDATFTGILTDPNLRATLHALKARTGSEVLGEPEVVTTSGRQCKMMATTVFTVVTNLLFEEQPPKSNVPSVTPQTCELETGVMLDAVPYVLADGYTLNLALIPSWVEFLGYAPTNSHAIKTSSGEKIDMPGIHPIIRTHALATTLTLWDNQTAVLGGMDSEKIVKEKVPVFSSLPLLGRLFEKQETLKTKTFVFVTATLVDPAGNRVHSDEELQLIQQAPLPRQP